MRDRRASSDAAKPHFKYAASYSALVLGLILFATFIAYGPSANGRMLWDDNKHVTKPSLQQLDGLYRIWFDLGATQQYYPLLHSAFWLEHQLWGDSVLGYHLANVFLHCLAVVLIYLNLTKLRVQGALIASAIFALHPVMVESVAWISEQKNTLSAVFYLSAMLAYLNFDQSRKPRSYVTSLTLFMLGLLTKTVTATLPAALLVIFWWQHGRLSWKRDVLPMAPMFSLGAIAGLTTAWVERKLIGAEGAAFEMSFLDRTVLAGRVIWFYLGQLLWPQDLTFIYPRWSINYLEPWQWSFAIAVLVVTGILLFVSRRSRAPLAGWLFFCGTLFPVLGFLNVFPFIYSFVADHFQYLASLGIIVPLSAAVASVLARLRLPLRRVGEVMVVLLIGTLAVLTFRQSAMYADTKTLYETTIVRNPKCWMAHNNLGWEFYSKGDRDQAAEHFRASLAIDPNNARAHRNLGITLTDSGDLERAVEHLRKAVEIQPAYAGARYYLGNALLKAGRVSEAIEELKASARLSNDDPATANGLGVALAQAGQLSDAVACFERALKLQSDNFDAHNNLGMILMNQEKPQQAIEHYRAAIASNPDSAQTHANLALAYAHVNQPDLAISTAEHAMQVARSTRQQTIGNQIEAWLRTYRASVEGRPSNGTSPTLKPPAQ